MTATTKERESAARFKAQERLEKSKKHDAEFFLERKKTETSNIAKTKRLKEMRMAKEALEREAAQALAAAKPVRAPRIRTAKVAVAKVETP